MTVKFFNNPGQNSSWIPVEIVVGKAAEYRLMIFFSLGIIQCYRYLQSYVIKSAPWTILWFRIFGIFSVENIKRLCVFMFQTCSNSQLLRRVLWISAEKTIGASLKHKNTQPLYIFSRVRVLHLNRLKEQTWLHSFAILMECYSTCRCTRFKSCYCFFLTCKKFHKTCSLNNEINIMFCDSKEMLIFLFHKW